MEFTQTPRMIYSFGYSYIQLANVAFQNITPTLSFLRTNHKIFRQMKLKLTKWRVCSEDIGDDIFDRPSRRANIMSGVVKRFKFVSWGT
jgi:hypothetical protein